MYGFVYHALFERSTEPGLFILLIQSPIRRKNNNTHTFFLQKHKGFNVTLKYKVLNGRPVCVCVCK